MGVAEPRRRTTLMALLEEVDTAERINEDRRMRETLKSRAAESNSNTIDDENGEDLIEVDEFVDSEEGGSSEDNLENNPDYTFCYYCDDFVFKDSWNPARRTKEDEYERYCLLHTGTSGYGRSYSKAEQVFGRSTIALQLPDEDSDPESVSESSRKDHKVKTANTQSARVKPERMTPEQEFLWEYGSSEDDGVEDEPRLVTKYGATRRRSSHREKETTPKKNRTEPCQLEKRSEQSAHCERKSPASLRKRRVVLSDEDSEETLQQSQSENATTKRPIQSPIRKNELETQTKQAFACEPKSSRKKRVVVSDEDLDEGLESATTAKRPIQPPLREQEPEKRSEQPSACERRISARSRKGTVVLSDADSEEGSESATSSKRPVQSPVQTPEPDKRSEQPCERESPARARKRTVILSDAELDEATTKRPIRPSARKHERAMRSEQTFRRESKSPRKKKVLLSDEDSEENTRLSQSAASEKWPTHPQVRKNEIEKRAGQTFHCEPVSPARSRKRRVVLSDEDSEDGLQQSESATSSKRPTRSPILKNELEKLSEQPFHCARKSPVRSRKKTITLSDEDSEEGLQKSEDAPSPRNELEKRSERTSPARSRKRTVVLSYADSEDSTESAPPSKRTKQSPVRQNEFEKRSERRSLARSLARSRSRAVALSGADSEEKLRPSESVPSSKRESPAGEYEVFVEINY
ncbi:hypothetical protein HDU81_011112 [Chytriomyces hyalinus]|nr:hypothetical protein HDU81_011112 [Chytriomyces hyalinus]